MNSKASCHACTCLVTRHTFRLHREHFLFSWCSTFYTQGIPYLMSSLLSSFNFSLVSCPPLSRVTESLYSRSLCQPWLLLWRSKLARCSGQGFHRGTRQRALPFPFRTPFSLCSDHCSITGPPGTLVMFDSNPSHYP